MSNSEATIEVTQDIFREYDREVLCVANLKTGLQPISLNIASIGAVNQAITQPLELLKSVIHSNDTSVILIYLHPFGSLTLSKEDVAMMVRMQKVFSLNGNQHAQLIHTRNLRSLLFFPRTQGNAGLGSHYTIEVSEINMKTTRLQKKSVMNQPTEDEERRKKKRMQMKARSDVQGFSVQDGMVWIRVAELLTHWIMPNIPAVLFH